MSIVAVCKRTLRALRVLSVPVPALALLLALALALAANTAVPMPVSGAIELRGSANTATTATTDLTIAKPSGVTTGDVMIVNISKVGNNTTAPTSTGWTLIDGRNLGGITPRYGAVLYRVVDGTEGVSFTFALGAGTTGAVGSIVAFSGVDVSGPTPFDVAPGTISVQLNQTDVVATSITTASPTAAVIMFGMVAGGAPSWDGWTTTSPGALTELYDDQKSTGSQASVGAAWATKSATGATGAGGATISIAARNGGILIALKPIPNPVPTTSSISPTSKTVGDAEFTLTVDGTNFVDGASVVRLDGADRATTFVSSTRLTAQILAGDLATGGGKSITVFTAAPGGGTSNAQILTVLKTTPVITWDNPADIVYGIALGSAQLCAATSVPGTFIYAPGVGAVLPAGDGQILHVEFTPTDAESYEAVSKNVTINVKKAALTITAASRNKTYGDLVTFSGTEFTANGLLMGDTVTGVTLASDGTGLGATVAGSPYSIVPSVAVGTGLANYNITYVAGTLTVNPKALNITAMNLSKAYGDTLAFAGTEFTADGLKNADTVTRVDLQSLGAQGHATADGSPYLIVPSGAVGTGLDNYCITYTNGYLTVRPAGISLSLSSSSEKSTRGRSVSFTAAVTGPGATGSITFMDGETVLVTATLSDGEATCSTSKLSVGSHSITAVYSGDANFAGCTSSSVDLYVRAAGWFSPAVLGWIVAAVAVALFFLLVILLRRRKRAPRTDTISRAMGVVFNDTVTSNLALSTVEEVSTYPIQLERELEKSIKRVEKSMEGAVQAICRTVETKDPYVAAHQKRVSQFACTIAKEMGLTTWQVDGIRVAGLLHDIGKVTVPTEILTKPGKLSKIEMAMIKDHPRVAFDILKNVEFDWPVARMVVQHHERMDGSGYPDGIKGEDILLEARILAVADVVEAMCTHRPYRPARGVDEALAELARGEGTLYDPEVVRACKKVLNERGFKVEFTSASA